MKPRIVTMLLLTVITVFTIHVSQRVLEGARVDVTSQNIYSLSEGTRQILGRMSDEGVQPVEITLYFSETAGKTLPRFIKDFVTYERYLRHLLRAFRGGYRIEGQRIPVGIGGIQREVLGGVLEDHHRLVEGLGRLVLGFGRFVAAADQNSNEGSGEQGEGPGASGG